MSDSLRVLIIPPGHPPELRTIPHTLEALQACVGGDLECWAIEDHVAIYCNEEGRLRGLPYNRRLTLPNGTSERFVGPILLTGFHDETGDSESLTEADLAIWTQRLLHPASPEIRHRTHYHRLSSCGRRSTLRLQFDANSRITDASARTWARSVAREWGSIHQETRFRIPTFDGWIGWFACAGHGGYVVITAENPPAWQRFAEEGHAVQPDPAWHHTSCFRFEEDVAWAVLETSLPDLAKARLRRTLIDRSHSTWLSPEQQHTAQQTLHQPSLLQAQWALHQEAIQRTMNTYHPDYPQRA